MNRIRRYAKYLMWSLILLYVVFLVRCVPAKWWFKRIYKVYSAREFSKAELKKIKKVAWFVRKIQKTFKIELTCLERSIAKQMILFNLGIYTTVLLGVIKEDDAIAAHAWILNEESVLGYKNLL